jgi:hypothetical protein
MVLIQAITFILGLEVSVLMGKTMEMIKLDGLAIRVLLVSVFPIKQISHSSMVRKVMDPD